MSKLMQTVSYALQLLLCIALYCSLAEESAEKGTNMYSDGYMHDVYHSGLRRISTKARTEHCKNYIEFEYMKHFRAHSEESPFPFEDIFFHSQCDSAWNKYPPLLPVYLREIPPRPELPAPPERKADPIPAETLSILYIVLVHNHLDFVKRLINALNEPQHTFVIHVDEKYPDMQTSLLEFSEHVENIFVMVENRQRLNWGGFSIVNATIYAMHHALLLERHFDYMIDLSGTHYPLKSNRAIREALAERPGAVYMDVGSEPTRPPVEMWHHYVECDDAIHRIGRLPLVRGMNMHIGSQWFAVPKHVVEWFVFDSLPYDYTFYATHVIVADENYFQTLFKNSPYCEDLIEKNFLFVLFDKWENERAEETVQERDRRKCLSPDPDHCGRSPTTLNLSFQKLLSISKALFARKFDPSNPDSMALVDLIDTWREKDAAGPIARGDEGNRFMIRQSDKELCWEMKMGDDGVSVTRCAPENPQQWFTLGPCTDNTNITIDSNGCAAPQQGEEEMFCQLQSGQRNVCVDVYGQNARPGAPLIGFECLGQWNQLFRFMSDCTISAVQPDLISRVRGMDTTNVTLCMESAYGSGEFKKNVLSMFTADCAGTGPGDSAKRSAQSFQLIREAEKEMKQRDQPGNMGPSMPPTLAAHARGLNFEGKAKTSISLEEEPKQERVVVEETGGSAFITVDGGEIYTIGDDL